MKRMRLGIAPLVLFASMGCTIPPDPVTWTSAQEEAITAAVGSVTEAALSAHLAGLDGVRNVRSAGADLAVYRDYILGRFASYGLQTAAIPVTCTLWVGSTLGNSYQREFTMENLEARKQGTDPALPAVYATAHWDSVDTGPGMDDNASGCAAVLEAARALSGLTVKRTVVFVLFGFEEDTLAGSSRYVETLTAFPSAVINFDCVAFTADTQVQLPVTDPVQGGNFILLATMEYAKDLALDFCRAADVFSPGLRYNLLINDAGMTNNPMGMNLIKSDHAPFVERGVPFLYLTDMGNFRNPYYHLPEDAIGTLDIGFLSDVTKASIALLCLKAGIVP